MTPLLKSRSKQHTSSFTSTSVVAGVEMTVQSFPHPSWTTDKANVGGVSLMTGVWALPSNAAGVWCPQVPRPQVAPPPSQTCFRKCFQLFFFLGDFTVYGKTIYSGCQQSTSNQHHCLGKNEAKQYTVDRHLHFIWSTHKEKTYTVGKLIFNFVFSDCSGEFSHSFGS